jgi:two-component system cell cycle sensor histidine kinase/response regulator CckA
VVHGIVESHKGCVSIESQPGIGTTVRVLLPRVSPPERERPGEREIPRRSSAAEKWSVAEDEPNFRRLIARILTDPGYRVILAADGEEAAREFDARPDEIDLVVLDYLMLRMTGSECYRRIKARKPSVKALRMTGYAVDAQFEGLRSAGGPVVLRKPFAIHDLARAVRNCLDG